MGDVVVVGAGSAGCAAAAALVAAGARVTLIEAGPSTLAGVGVVADVVARPDANDCVPSGPLDWGYVATEGERRQVPVPRGRVLGGSSVINTCVAVRPDPDSFDRWAAHVGGGWSWDEVADDFAAIERDVDHGAADHHGADGPVTVVRWRDDEMEAPSEAFVAACAARGLRRVDDLNAPGAHGVGAIPMNRVGIDRVSSDRAFLEPLVAAGDPNLRIVTGELVDRVVVERGRAVAVETVRGGTVGTRGVVRHAADRVVLCAGSYGTPAILQRSGIGPAGHLRSIGIDVVADLPVGDGLHDHPQVPLAAGGPPGARDRAAMQVLVKTTTPDSEVANDVQLTVFNRVDVERFEVPVRAGVGADEHVVLLCAALQHSEQRGTVRIVGRDPSAPPRIELAHLVAAADRRRMRHALRELAAIAAAGPTGRLRSPDVDAVARLTDDELDALAVARVQTSHHPMGTAAMAAPTDSGVVDRDLRVRGVDGLTVADASVIPRSINANIHLTCTMIGWRHGQALAADPSPRSDEWPWSGE